MKRYATVDTKSGEVVAETNTDPTKAARLAHRKALWAWEDRQRGKVSGRRVRTRQKAGTWGVEGWIVLVGLLLLMLTM